MLPFPTVPVYRHLLRKITPIPFYRVRRSQQLELRYAVELGAHAVREKMRTSAEVHAALHSLASSLEPLNSDFIRKWQEIAPKTSGGTENTTVQVNTANTCDPTFSEEGISNEDHNGTVLRRYFEPHRRDSELDRFSMHMR